MSTIAPPQESAPIGRPATVSRPPRARLLRGADTDPPWVRPSLLLLLGATAALYLWGLGASGWANAYYSAAAQAGAQSWKALFFGSSDAANFITVDKAPAALWLMGLSARVFGVNAWSILVPEALAGVGSVGLLYATVRRAARPGAGLLAGAVLATTPVAALMFRFNNPDALLMLLLIGSAYAVTRAVESGQTRWLVLAGSLVGFGFLAKMLQALLVLPALGLTYLLAGPTPLRRRIVQLFAGAGAMVVAAGWWVAAVQLWPASSRPYIGGSQNNSIWNLMFGYNGFGRLTGDEPGSVGGGGQAGSRWGITGLGRMFNNEYGTQVAWLLPAALVLLVAGLVVSRKARRTNRTRAGLVLWGTWLVVTTLTFSLGRGIIHPYYSVALGPAIGAVAGIGASLLWSRRHDPVARNVLGATLALTATWSYALLGRAPAWPPGLRAAVLVAGLGLAVALVAAPRLHGRLAGALAAGAVIVGLAGPGAYSVATAATPHSGAIPSSGPAGAGRFGPDGGAGGGRGGIGGLLKGTTPSAALTAVLGQDSDRYTWVAATVLSNNAAGYQLATGDPVMAIGGFNGTDPAPTLAQFQAYVAAGRIHWFVAGAGPGGNTGTAAQIAAWVASSFPSSSVGGTTLYDLTVAR
jgi:4-amino-4-deoxy-L-arabinose transferase-like glycosyltransferase